MTQFTLKILCVCDCDNLLHLCEFPVCNVKAQMNNDFFKSVPNYFQSQHMLYLSYIWACFRSPTFILSWGQWLTETRDHDKALQYVNTAGVSAGADARGLAVVYLTLRYITIK